MLQSADGNRQQEQRRDVSSKPFMLLDGATNKNRLQLIFAAKSSALKQLNRKQKTKIIFAKAIVTVRV